VIDSVDSQHPHDPHDVWDNPLATRYASAEMTAIWSDRNRYRHWRRTWLALAEAEAELGLPRAGRLRTRRRLRASDAA